MRNERLHVKVLANAVPAKGRDDRVAVCVRPVAVRRAHIAEEVPRTRRRNAALHTLLRHTHKPLCRSRHLANEVHTRGIRVVAAKDDRRVDVDNVPLLQHILLRGNAVADHIVDRGADALRKPLKPETGGDPAALHDVVVRRTVERLRIHARTHERLHEIEHAIVDDRSPADPLNIRRVVDDLARRAHLSLDHIIANGRNAVIKVRMTLLVFLSAAAPA